jgi:hypothetical protein
MKAPGGGGLNNRLEIRELRRILAEACGGRTHQPVIRFRTMKNQQLPRLSVAERGKM